jgi:hypothetical protein
VADGRIAFFYSCKSASFLSVLIGVHQRPIILCTVPSHEAIVYRSAFHTKSSAPTTNPIAA